MHPDSFARNVALARRVLETPPFPMVPSRSHRPSLRGFTLVEMMTVVVLVGILATLSVYGVRKYILSAKSGEAVSMMSNIKAAEEAFKDETFVYLDVSQTFADGNFYPFNPATSPQGVKVQWGASGTAQAANFKTLGVQPDAPVAFAYAVVATGPGGTVPELPTNKKLSQFGLPTTPTRWQYIAVARADLGSTKGVYTAVVSHSYSAEIYVENEGD
jgi:prepilin-type N-terminal cleavage/methylation domain-containing protein